MVNRSMSPAVEKGLYFYNQYTSQFKSGDLIRTWEIKEMKEEEKGDEYWNN